MIGFLINTVLGVLFLLVVFGMIAMAVKLIRDGLCG